MLNETQGGMNMMTGKQNKVRRFDGGLYIHNIIVINGS